MGKGIVADRPALPSARGGDDMEGTLTAPAAAPAGGSAFAAKVVTVTLEPHDNADTLSVATVLGWHCVVRTADFVETLPDGTTRPKTDRGVYIPIDALVPVERLRAWGLEGRLAGPNKDRVKTIRLRGKISQGLLIPVSRHDGYEIGDDVTAQWGITKYDPPLPETMNGAPRPWPAGLARFDVERLENFPGILVPGEEVVATEKLEGTNAAFHIWEADAPGTYEFAVCSRGIAFDPARSENADNIYCRIARDLGIGARLEEALRSGALDRYVNGPVRDVTVRGEIIGGKVQGNIYKLPALTFRCFDVYVDGRPLDHDAYRALAAELGLEVVPEVYRGPFPEGEGYREISYGRSTLPGSAETLREGVVWKPLRERTHPEIGRVMLKAVDPAYLAGQKD